jgi:hypothetical protein
MHYLFYTLVFTIMGLVLFLAARAISAGLDAKFIVKNAKSKIKRKRKRKK